MRVWSRIFIIIEYSVAKGRIWTSTALWNKPEKEIENQRYKNHEDMNQKWSSKITMHDCMHGRRLKCFTWSDWHKIRVVRAQIGAIWLSYFELLICILRRRCACVRQKRNRFSPLVKKLYSATAGPPAAAGDEKNAYLMNEVNCNFVYKDGNYQLWRWLLFYLPLSGMTREWRRIYQIYNIQVPKQNLNNWHQILCNSWRRGSHSFIP